VACTKGAAPSITLGAGANASGSTRQLAFGSERLTYELFSNSGRTTVWNSTNVLTPGAAPSKAARDFSVYGRIASGQDVSAGSYTDTVVATVNF
jgi:spore coat protein U-like protein